MEDKREYVSANMAGSKQTLSKGNAMDWLHELVWDSREKIDEIIAFFEAYKAQFPTKGEVAESIPLKIKDESGEILKESEIIATVADGTVTVDTEKAIKDIEELEAETDEEDLIAETIEDAVAESVEVLTPENETVSEIEQLKARIRELEQGKEE